MNEHDSTSHLLSEDRYKWQDPVRIANELGPLSGYVLDSACGPGFFTIELAKAIAGKGSIDAVDSDPKAIAVLNERIKTLDLKVQYSVRARAADVERMYFPERSFDLVFIANSFHDLKDKDGFLIKVSRILKTDGRVVNIDWRAEPTEIGPPQEIRISDEKCISMFEKHGFKLNSKIYGGEYHYGLVFTKTGS